MLRAAVGQVVAGDAGDDDVRQAQADGAASATRRGSSASGGSRPALGTLQKRHARVHMSPRIMNVAVFCGVALHAIGASGMVADRLQPQLLDQPGREVVGVALGHVSLQPARQGVGRAGLGISASGMASPVAMR